MIAAILIAATCVPDVVSWTPTPVAEWVQDYPAGGGGYAPTAGYRVYWQRTGDTSWRGSTDWPAFHGDAEQGPIYPGISLGFPLQRAYPTNVQAEEIRMVVKAVSAANVESAPSEIITICAPKVYPGRPAPYN